jgi:YVTN family beta-propeller protein
MKNIRSKFSKVFSVSCFFFPLLFCFTGCNAQSYSHKILLALSKTDHKLVMLDPVTFHIIAKIPVGEDPHEVIASSDGKTAYVSIYGGGSLHELNVIDLVQKKPSYNIDTRPLFGPHGLAFVNGKVWFTAEGSKCVGRYDPVTKKLDWSMGTGQDRTHMIYVSANGKRVYTTNVASGTVSLFVDTLMRQEPPPGRMNPPGKKPDSGRMPPPHFAANHENWEQTIIPVSTGSEGFDVSPDGSELWTGSAEDGNIFIIDLSAKKLSTKVEAQVFGANRLKFTPDGKMVFISSLQSGDVAIYDTKTHNQLKRLNVGHGAAGILMDPDSSRAFVASSGDNYLAVIDLKSLTVTGKIDVGGMPDGLAWSIQP